MTGPPFHLVCGLLTRTCPLTWLPFQLTAVLECLFAIVMAKSHGLWNWQHQLLAFVRLKAEAVAVAAFCPLPHHYGLSRFCRSWFSPTSPSNLAAFPSISRLSPELFVVGERLICRAHWMSRIEIWSQSRVSRPEVATAAGCIDNHSPCVRTMGMFRIQLARNFLCGFSERGISISVCFRLGQTGKSMLQK